MKIQSTYKKDNKNNSDVGIEEIIENATKNNQLIFASSIDDIVFIFKPITRKQYKIIYMNNEITEEDKKDEICKTCLLWPQDFDLENCSAGIPDALADEILEKSCIDTESIKALIDINRIEMEQDSWHKMVCTISEAFPAYKVEEIEAWDMYKFIEMFVKSEWKIKEYKGLEVTLLDEKTNNNAEYQEYEEPEYRDYVISNNHNVDKPKEKNGMTEKDYQEYLEFVKKFPDIDMSRDAAFTGGESIKADTLPPALRPGWG